MCAPGARGVVTLLDNELNIIGVDRDFRKLAALFHCIPFCATWGVSCAGHFDTHPGNNCPGLFYPKPYGNLTIIVLPEKNHIIELLETINTSIVPFQDAGFERIQHYFAPPPTSPLETWRITINDNGCLGKLTGSYWGGYLEIREYPEIFNAARKRADEIRKFWKCLENSVAQYYVQHGFSGFDLEGRKQEIRQYLF